jgi:DNA-binding response OmpR family regulator
MILAMEMESLVADLGAGRVDSAPSLGVARELLAANRYDVVLLDVELAGVKSFELAELAQEQGVPVIFVSGYGSHVELPERLAGAATIGKPVDRQLLSAKLSELNLRGTE